MIEPTTAAIVFSIFTSVGVIFQLALALGAPWGEMAMGGKFPGRFPPKMRISALVQMVLLVLIAIVVLTRAGLVLNEFFLRVINVKLWNFNNNVVYFKYVFLFIYWINIPCYVIKNKKYSKVADPEIKKAIYKMGPYYHYKILANKDLYVLLDNKWQRLRYRK